MDSKINLILETLTNKIDKNIVVCSCSLQKLFKEEVTVEKRQSILSDLFWLTWLDQVLFYLLQDNKNENSLNQPELYETINEKFSIIHLKEHFNGKPFLPSRLLTINCIMENGGPDLLGNAKVLANSKIYWWDESIKDFLQEIGREDIVSLVNKEIINDLHSTKFNDEERDVLQKIWFSSLSTMQDIRLKNFYKQCPVCLNDSAIHSLFESRECSVCGNLLTLDNSTRKYLWNRYVD